MTLKIPWLCPRPAEKKKPFCKPALLMMGMVLAFTGCESSPPAPPPPQIAPAIPVSNTPAIKEDTVLLELLRTQRELLATKADLQNQQTQLTGDIAQTKEALADYENEVRAYLKEHPEAVACILAGVGGVAVATDEDSEVTDEARSVATGVAVVAAIYALAHAEEVSEVGQVMVEADTKIKRLKGEIQSQQNTLSALNDELGEIKDQLRQTESAIRQRKAGTSNLVY